METRSALKVVPQSLAEFGRRLALLLGQAFQTEILLKIPEGPVEDPLATADFLATV